MKSHLLVLLFALNSIKGSTIIQEASKETNILKNRRVKAKSLQKQQELGFGRFSSLLHRGKWESPKPSQNKFLEGYKGSIMVAFALNENDPASLTFYFEFFEGDLIENRYIFSDVQVSQTKEDSSMLKGFDQKARFNRTDKIFEDQGDIFCDLTVSLNIMNKRGNKVDIHNQDERDVFIQGYITSKECDIQFDFKAYPESLRLFEISAFCLIQIIAIFIGLIPFYKILNEGDVSYLYNLSDSTFLMNIAVEFVILTINMTLAVRILPAYFEFLTFINMFYMISIPFKVRFYFYLFELKVNADSPTLDHARGQKFYFMMKFMIICSFSITFADFFIIHYQLFYILFTYPLLQIMYNSFNVMKKNCFKFDLHAALILSQSVYPICLRSLGFEFLQLKQDFMFGMILFALVMTQLLSLLMQRLFSPKFFLPKFLIPGFFDYFRKISKLDTLEDINCPICFIDLSESPDTDMTTQSSFVPERFMETPCKHQFHEECLQKWMEHKLICPCCRMSIPPI